ncbi:hypothetical protein H109_06100 [Trichophyton interdigitale MR816]|uniref:Uncharacterized protein n=1 Tax=Trichophyton interdigitale (strain MR816) TaxID=1215338 RepID=A0A059J275_TRIIM|nr:hypothetical protein H101_02819 [Trichophyton interdigitale H6]KDB21960.1 hypothetical protein H109_06100 [Trichophyton interdigitale MR816]
MELLPTPSVQMSGVSTPGTSISAVTRDERVKSKDRSDLRPRNRSGGRYGRLVRVCCFAQELGWVNFLKSQSCSIAAIWHGATPAPALSHPSWSSGAGWTKSTAVAKMGMLARRG